MNFMIVDWGRGPMGQISLQNSAFLKFLGQKHMGRFMWNFSRRKYCYKHKCKSSDAQVQVLKQQVQVQVPDSQVQA